MRPDVRQSQSCASMSRETEIVMFGWGKIADASFVMCGLVGSPCMWYVYRRAFKIVNLLLHRARKRQFQKAKYVYV